MIEETVGGRLAKTLDFFGVVCDLDCSDIPLPEPPDSCRFITSSLLPKKQAQRVAVQSYVLKLLRFMYSTNKHNHLSRPRGYCFRSCSCLFLDYDLLSFVFITL